MAPAEAAPAPGGGDVLVSVVVPTYCSTEFLDGLVACLDAQTLPPSQLEVLLVDDGSPDDTFARVEELAATRPHLRPHRIEHSGWPSRPRNVGLDLARGEYVLFLDHDDRVFPDGLRACAAYGREHGADVVVGKEVRTDDLYAFGRFFDRDRPGPAEDRLGAFGPLTTHKLFRREFLLETGIRFPGGRRRFWEDVMLGMEVCARTDRISVLSSTPFYTWVYRGQDNTSSRYEWDLDEYVRSLVDMYAHAEASGARTADVERLERQQYAVRVLDYLTGPGSMGRERYWGPEYYRRGVELARTFAEEHVSPHLEADLGVERRLRAFLLRAGEKELLRDLALVDGQVRVSAQVTSARWSPEGRLDVEVAGRWDLVHGAPMRLRREGDRIHRVLPAGFGAVPRELLDVTAEIEALQVHVSLTRRSDHLGWPVPARTEAVLVDSDRHPGEVELGYRVRASVDPRSGALGAALGPGVWDLGVRPGLVVHALRLPTYDGASLPRLGDEGVQVAYATRSTGLALDVGSQVHGVFSSTVPAGDRAGVTRDGKDLVLSVPVPALAGDGPPAASVPGRVGLRDLATKSTEWFPAAVTAQGLRSTLRARSGTYRVWVDDDSPHDPRPTRLFLEVGRRGRVSLGRRADAPGARSWDGSTPP